MSGRLGSVLTALQLDTAWWKVFVGRVETDKAFRIFGLQERTVHVWLNQILPRLYRSIGDNLVDSSLLCISKVERVFPETRIEVLRICSLVKSI